MRVIQIACICFILLIANSCKNDIEINAPWKETPVVYAFIDPNTNTQFFRIQKTYQNSTDLSTAEGALIADSLYFDTLSVKVVDGYNNTYVFHKTKNVPKDDGFFANGAHYLYECKGFTGIFNRNYTLQLFSPKTGNTYSASTRCVGTSAVSAVRLRFDATNVNSSSTITTTISSGSAVYDQIMRLVYVEYPTGGTGGDTLNADYVFSEDSEPYSANGSFRIKTSKFVNSIKNTIPQKSGVERKIVRIDFVNVGGAKELADLIELSKPSISIVQKKIDYTNITQGLGIFSSRSYKLTPKIENLESQWNTAQKQLLINALNALDYADIVSKNLQFVP